MPKTRPPYSPEFRRQMIDLVRAGRSLEDLSREFEPTAQSIGAWVAAADKQEGRREETIPGLAASERDILSKAAAWVARETGAVPSGSSRFMSANQACFPQARRAPDE